MDGKRIHIINQHREIQMDNEINRRDFLKLTAIGGIGVVFASALPGMARAAGQDAFYFVQMSDTHWGVEGPPNPDAKGTLQKAGAAGTRLWRQPAIAKLTGERSHQTNKSVEHRQG